MKKTLKFMFVFSMIIYILLLIYAFFLKAVPLDTLFSSDRNFIRSVNLTPFHTIGIYIERLQYDFRGFAMHNLVGNVILFMPLGIYIELLRKKSNIWISLLIVILTSVGVELIQYIFGLGITDIDDLILNFVGGFLGIIIYRVAFLIFKDKAKMMMIVTISASVVMVLFLILLLLLLIANVRMF